MATINQTSSSNTLLANIIPVPSMSTQGLVYDSSNKIDKLLAHAFVADYNQSYLYAGRITSLAAYIAQGGSRSDEVISKIQQGLTTYLAKYYTNVDVTVAQITKLCGKKIPVMKSFSPIPEAQGAVLFKTIVTPARHLKVA